MIQAVTTIQHLPPPELINYLTNNLSAVGYKELFKGVESSSNSILATVIYKAALNAKNNETNFQLTIETAEKKAAALANLRRKKFVRRVYKHHPLFAIQFIRERYPFYDEAELLADITIKRKVTSIRKSKKPSNLGLRVSQITKLSTMLTFSNVTETERHKICNKIVGYQNALQFKVPITLRVKYNGETREYFFPWNETEGRVKSFISATKRVNSFQELDNNWKKSSFAGN